MAKKKQLKFNINNATKGKTYDLKNVSDIYITYDSNLEDCLDMSVSGSTLTMKVSGNVVVYKFTNISDSMPIKVYHSNGTEKFNGTLQEFYSTYDFTPVDYSYTTKKNVITGTALSDDIDVHDKTYNGKGYTINAGAGDDTIRGTLKADTITGGAGNNVINYTKGDGNDVINLTKNETLTINMSNAEDVYTIDDLKFAYANKNKDLRIYTDKNSTAEFITIKNFASKDVNGNGDVFLTIGKKTYNLETSQNVTNPINPVDVALYKTTLTGKGSNFTGTWLNDEIDASAVEGRTQKVKKQVVDLSTNKGLTLNGGNGNDTITGSKYSDTIKGGNGNDVIYASNGNDAITGGKGTNTLIYSATPFGKDTITLTKNENLTITGLVYKEGKTLATSCSKSGNNLLIDTEHGQVVLKNFYTKNTGATVNVDGMNLSEVNLLAEVNAANYFEIPGKKLNAKYTGTALADIVNASGLSKQTAKGGVGVTINTGLGADEVTGSNFKDTINTGDGNDTINGSLGADKLTGGTGENEIIYTTLAQLDGDTINLTKNEKLDICVNVAGATATYKVSGKNLVVTVNDGNETKSFTIANFGTKDITTSNGAVNLILNGADPVDLRTVTLTELNVTKNYTGTWHADNINASAATKGVTLNGGAGNDIIVGSALKDTIKGGAGDDTITGGLGNDNLYGEGGKNTFIFNKGDKNDTLYSGKGTDTLKFTDASDLTFTKSGKTDLIVKYNYNDEGTAQDSITIKNYFDKKGKNVVSSVKYVEMLGKTYDIETLRTYADENEGKLPVVVNEDYNHPEDNADKVIIADNTTQETKTITTGDGDNVIYASENTATNIVTGNGNNEIHGGNGGTITTGTGNDVINSGNSTQINAGAGENEIHLEQNSNTVVVNTTDQENPTHNTIIFEDKQEEGNTIVFADKTLDEIQDENTGVTFVKEGNDLVIVQDENNTTTLTDYLNQDNENVSETTIKGSGEPTATLTEIINNKGIEVTASDEGGVTEGTGYNDNITGSNNNDVIYTNSQNAVGGTGSNVVNAGAGDDEIHLQEAHNEIHIGAANGNDTIIFEENQTNGNTIVFDDKTLEQVEAGTTFTKEGNDLVIHKDENNTVILKDFLNEENENVNENIIIKGSDGATQSTSLDELLTEATITISGSENIEGTKYSDNITGSNTGDLIDAGAGADTVTGGAGNDIIIGGLGNDTLTGGTGNNIFIFNENDGKDTITDATSSDTIKLDYTPEQEPTYSVADGTLTIKIDEDNQITTNFNYNDSTNNIDTIIIKDENEPSGYKEVSLLEDVVFDKTISVNDTDYEKTTPYSEIITIAEGVTGVSVSGLNENDSIQVAVDDEQQPTYSRTDNGGLVISGTNDNAVTVTDFFTNGEDITVNGNTTEDITVNVTLTNALEGTYESTDYNEVISGTGTVSGLTSDDKVEVEGAVSYSRTNNGALVIEGATSGAITVSDFNFNNPQTINVNDGTTENMTVNVTLTEDYNYTATACKEVISGQGSVSGATSNTIIYMGDDCEDAATCVGNDITFTNNDDNVAITIKGFFNDNGDIVFAGNCCVDGTAIEDKYESVALNDIDLTVSGRTNFSNVIEYQGEEHTIFHSVNITGTDNADTFIGGEGEDTISGGAGNDTITGGQGNDTLTGGTGENTFIFNSGDGVDHILDATNDDVIRIDSAGDVDIEQIEEDGVKKLQITYNGGTVVTNYDFVNPENTNIDTVMVKQADGSYEEVSIKENVIVPVNVDEDYNKTSDLKENLVIADDAGDITVTGLTVKDKITFAEGNDPEYSLSGDGLVVEGDTTTVTVAQAGADMTHRVFVNGVADDLSDKTLTVTGLENFNGSDLGFGNYDITGTAEGNTLIGGAGADTISGGAGDDIIYGGNGANTINGGAGNDTLNGGTGNDVITGGTGNDTINAGAGNNAILYSLGDGDDIINAGGGTDTLVFEAGTTVTATYGSTSANKNDLILTYSGTVDETPVSNTITLKNYKTTAHSVSQIKIGNETSDIADLISIGTTEYYTRDMGLWPILQRGVYGTDSAETLAGTPTGYYATNYVNGESYYTYGGNDNIVLRRTSDNGRLLDNVATFKVGDGNDAIKNSEWVKDGAALYSEEQAIYQEKVYTYSHGSDVSDTHGSTGLNFKGVHLNAITAEKDGNDIVITYATANTTDTVRIKNGYYSTNVDGITAYDIDSSVYQVTQPMYYADVLPNSEEWESHRQTQQTTDYGYGYGVNEDGSLIDGTKWYESTTLRDLVHDKNIVNGEDATLNGWIWSDSISASDDKGHTINGYGGSDTLTGGALADTIYGGEGHDIINGSDGNDVIYGFRVEDPEEHVSSYISDNDTINGGAGNDTIYGGYGYDTINGGTGEDEIHGSVYYSTIHGDADNDNIEGVGELYGDGGNDTITGKGKLYGGAGDDTITLQANQYGPYIEDAEGNEVYAYADGGDGNDTINLSLNYATRNAVVLGGAGDDEIGSTRYYDEELGRWVFPSYTRDVNIDAGSGNDHIVIRSEQRTQNVTIQGGAGDDTIEYQYSFRADSIGTGIDNTDVSIIKDSSGNDTLALIGTNNMSYHGNGATPVAFFDMTIDNNGNITSLGEDNSLYVATTFAGSTNSHNLRAYGDKTKSLKLESVLSQNGNILSSSIENIYIRGEWMSDECGYYKLDVENLAKAYANYLKTTTYRSLQAALTNGTAQIKEDLAQIAIGSWTHTMYRPVLESDDQAVYGDGTDKVLDADYGYAIGSDANETINGTTIEGVNGYYDGGAGNDTINAGEGDDVLIGGVGNDTLSGGDGADKFYFSVGDGNDVITDAASVDTIVLVGVTDFSDITLTQKEDNKTSLFINYGDTDTIEIQNYFVQTQHPEYKAPGDPGYNPEYHSLIPQYIYTKAEGAISKIGFVPSVLNDNQILNTSDETYNFAYTEPDYYTDPTAIVYNYDTPQKIYSEKTGDAGNNNLVGDNNKLNVIKGLAGNDTITGGNQADVIYGGTGNDTINAGAGQNFIHYALGDGNDTITSGGGEDTLVFAEGTNVIAAYGTGEHANDLILTYSGNGQSNTITLTNYKTTEHSVKHVQIGNVIQNPSDLIAIAQTDYYGPFGNTFPYRAAFGTNNAEIITSVGGKQFENYHSYGGNDKIAIQATFDNNGTPQNTENDIYFKPGDGNDTIMNAERIKEGAALYSNEQAEYQERLFKPVAGSPRVSELTFVNVRLDDITTERDGDDLILHYTENDSVRIKGGYYSTYIGKIGTYTDSGTGRKLYYGDGEPGSAEWIATRQEITDYYQDTDGESETESARLSDIVEGETISGDGDLNGWIWKDTITGGDGADNINGHNGNDAIDGGAGNDTIYGGSDNDTINGGDGDDVIYGYRELLDGETVMNKNLTEEGYIEDNDTINSGAGNDTIYGGLGNDYIDGGAGDDIIYGPQYKDNAGWTNFIASTIKGGVGSDTIIGQGTIYADDVTINGNTVTDVQAGAGNDNILGAGTIYAGFGDDVISYRGGYTITPHWWMSPQYIKGYLYAGEGNDTITLINDDRGIYTNFYNDAEVYAGAGDDKITGQTMTLIDGGAGNDHINVVQAHNYNLVSVIDGGTGDDLIEFSQHNDMYDFRNHTIKNSGGTDTVVIAGVAYHTQHHQNPEEDTTTSPLAFFSDLTINNSGQIQTVGNDIYISDGSSDYGDIELSLKLEGATGGAFAGGIYIKNNEDNYWSYNPEEQSLKHGYRTLNINVLKTKYAEWLYNDGDVRFGGSLATALADEDARAALAEIAKSDAVWEYTVYRPNFDTDTEAVRGDDTDQTLKPHFNAYKAYHPESRLANDEFFVGGSGNERILSTGFGNDVIYAGEGNDFIYAGRGNDEIHAGTGNNTMVFYNDYEYRYYEYNGNYENASKADATDGNDVVYANEGGVDTLDFGQSIAVKFQKSNNDLKVYYNFDDSGVGKSSVTVKDFYVGNALNNNCSVKKIKLLGQDVADLTAEYIASNEYTTDADDLEVAHDNKVVYFGTENADNITVKYKNNFVYGGSGADTIETVNELITGENYLDGGAGDDIYRVGVNTKTTIYDSGNDGTVVISSKKTQTHGFYDMAVTVKDGAIVDYDYKALRLYTTADGVDYSLNILANPNLAGTQDNNVAATVTEIQTTEEIGYQKITNANLEGIAQSTASWMSTHCAGMADGTYSTADIVSAGGENANILTGYVQNAWQLGQS